MTTIISRRPSMEADDTPGPVIEMALKAPLVDEGPADVNAAYFAEQAFLAEWVEIVLQPMDAALGEPEVPISVNGDRISLRPGIPTKIRRYHLDRLVRARPDSVTRDGGRPTTPEEQRNIVYRQSFSRYNFDVVGDTPKGLAWLAELRRRYTRR